MKTIKFVISVVAFVLSAYFVSLTLATFVIFVQYLTGGWNALSVQENLKPLVMFCFLLGIIFLSACTVGFFAVGAKFLKSSKETDSSYIG
jgi:hypothetical protein